MRITELAEKIRNGEIDVLEHTEKVLEQAEKLNSEYHFLNTISKDRALANAKAIKENPQGRLAGVPISIKDSIVVKGVESTGGSRILKGYVPVFNATCVENGEQEGAIVIGKSSQDEFGFGSFSTNVGLGFTTPLNPVDKDRACGGSSGGAAGLAKRAEFPTFSYGESTGGSIVCPASFCGVYGMCPTYGRVSRYGLIDYGNSLDKVGPLSKYIEDISLGLSVISGHDPKDSTSAKDQDTDFDSFLDKDPKDMKVGVITETFGEGTKQDVQDSVWDGIKELESNGVKYEEVSTPLALKYGLSAYYILATSEASTNLAKYCGMRYGSHEALEGGFNEYFTKVRSQHFGEEAKRRIIIGTFARMAGVRDAYYIKAAQIRTMIINEYKSLFKKYDALISPAVPYPAPTFSEIEKLTPLEGYMADLMTVSPNLAGVPHMTIPVKEKAGLPIGLMAVGDHFKEGNLITLGKTLQK